MAIAITGNTVQAEADGAFSFLVTRDMNIFSQESFTYALGGTGSSPTSPADFITFPVGSLNFSIGESSKPLSILINRDAFTEPDEQFTLTVSAGLGTAVPLASITATLQDSPPPPPSLRLSGSTSDREGDAGTTALVYTVIRSGITTGTSAVAYTVTGSGASATSAADFVGGVFPSGTLTFDPGVTSRTITIPILGDAVMEPNEAFVLTLSDPVNALLGTASITTTIYNDDYTHFVLGNAISQLEGDSGATKFAFTVTRSGDLSGGATVDYAVQSLEGNNNGIIAALASDFVGGSFPSGRVSFAPGETSKTIDIMVAGDTAVEFDERFGLQLSNPLGPLGSFGMMLDNAYSGGTILTDEPPPVLSLSGPGSVQEGNSGTTTITYTVTRVGDLREGSSFQYAAAVDPYSYVSVRRDLTTLSQNEFVGGVFPSGVVNFAPGETVKTFTISILGDLFAEPDELLTIEGFRAVGASVAKGSVSTIIYNDDGGTTATAAKFSLTGPGAKLEGSTGGSTNFDFVITRNADLLAAATVEYSVVEVSAKAGDFFGYDLYFPRASVTFAPGETSKTISIPVRADTAVEPDKIFKVILVDYGGTALPGNLGVLATILNDDVALSTVLSVSSPGSLAEGDSGTQTFAFTVSRTGSTSGSSSVTYAVKGGSASASDFVGAIFPSGTLSFFAGETSKTINIAVAGERIFEPDEDFTLTLVNPVGATLATASATATILNDDRDGPTLPTGQEAASTLNTAFGNILKATPSLSDAGLLTGLAAQLVAGTLTRDQALSQLLDRADATTSVATMAYEFFTGKIPSAGGMDYLVSPTGSNPNNLNSPYYQSFSIENRNINFAVNLGKNGDGAAKFAAEYGALDLLAATTKAYQTIFGTAPSAEKVHALIDSRVDYFAYYGQDGANGIGTKAAMVGWLLAEAEKANIGTYAKSNAAFLMDLADGAAYAVDIVGVYGKPEFAI